MDSSISTGLFNESQLKFIQILIEKGSVDVEEMAEIIGVSKATIYNYYNYISTLSFERRKGKILLYHKEPNNSELSENDPFEARMLENVKLKVKLAQTIVTEIIKPGDLIFLDCGSSNMFIAEQILEYQINALKVVTNNPYIFCRLHKYDGLEQLSVIGGIYNRDRGSFHGDWVDQLLKIIEKDHKFNKAFIGSDGITVDDGRGFIYLTDAEERDQKLRLMSMSNEIYFPMDQSKIGKAGAILAQTDDENWKKIKVVMEYEEKKPEGYENFTKEFGEEKFFLVDTSSN